MSKAKVMKAWAVILNDGCWLYEAWYQTKAEAELQAQQYFDECPEDGPLEVIPVEIRPVKRRRSR